MQNDNYNLSSNLNHNPKAWVVTANMGYGHQRAVYPLRDIAEDNIITVGIDDSASKNEEKMWKRVIDVYEFISRAKGIPFIGDSLFNLLDALMYIPSYYPIRDLSNTTFQVKLLRSNINKGLCDGMLNKIKEKDLPLITSFYAPAIAADMKGYQKVFCIICDADINRVWVAMEPWESRIEYFVPCGKAAQRLRAYGVPNERIFTTGFPLPTELLGGPDLPILKSNLSKRLLRLDPTKKFWDRHRINVEHFLGKDIPEIESEQKITITYAVGGAGAQKEIGGKIANSLKDKINKGKVKLYLVAGIRQDVRDYFKSVKEKINVDDSKIEIIYGKTLYEYFMKFNKILNDTDVLWTKPSELSFYCALGIPIIMSTPIGAQEKFNTRWLYEVQAGIRQENPDYTDQWFFELLNEGRLAEAAWSGFLKARKLGTYKIFEVLKTGKMSIDNSPILR
jgi:hypothetical protein